VGCWPRRVPGVNGWRAGPGSTRVPYIKLVHVRRITFPRDLASRVRGGVSVSGGGRWTGALPRSRTRPARLRAAAPALERVVQRANSALDRPSASMPTTTRAISHPAPHEHEHGVGARVRDARAHFVSHIGNELKLRRRAPRRAPGCPSLTSSCSRFAAVRADAVCTSEAEQAPRVLHRADVRYMMRPLYPQTT
jgi:hypothetical protein